MTDTPSEALVADGASPADDEDVISVLDTPESRDWHLAELVDYANRFKVELHVTLAVGGLLITGQIMNGADYFEQMAVTLDRAPTTGAAAGVTSDDGQSLGQLMAQGQRGWKPLYPEGEEAIRKGFTVPSYIHLRNARYVSQGGQLPSSGVLVWRGRLDAVDGWSLGEFRIG